ncbi:LacI family DNA-binding transcriptional regulator [Bradyrhizobium manausense]|uniref:LacI family DNA-binding transcriptional regulator n=1 Tax=Bradyrhizobium manausense TaxID=989370 RepID=UPI001BAB9DEF|nr:LacI family DNA-binding transcriptional regulator [Bradyrhizobium manausense]MBR0724185.1 LacI family DNA-binding transcriptional regulator [Bradyrhizobium manausense]
MNVEKRTRAASEPSAGADLTLRDIARLAGVSISTVSRVINRRDIVAPSKQKAVDKVLKQFSYIPNNAARLLISGRSMTIGLVVPTMSNPLFAPTIESAEETLRAAGYGVLVACSNRDPDRELDQAKTMMERGVDGMILTGANHRPDLLTLLRAKRIAAVFQDCSHSYPGFLSIAMQDAAAMALAIDTLVERGHRRIALLTGPTGNTPPVADRLRGARKQLAKHGLQVGADDIAETPDYDAASAREAVSRLLMRRPRYTAIACTGDILALGAIMAIRHAGLAVPADISIIGCSDSVMAQYVDPPLTTIHLPFKRMGEIAAAQLLRGLESHRLNGRKVLDYQLMDRQSVRSLQS